MKQYMPTYTTEDSDRSDEMYCSSEWEEFLTTSDDDYETELCFD